MQTTHTLFTLSDGSILRSISSRELIMIPTWKGNRVVDAAHADAIKQAVWPLVDRLDHGYQIVTYTVEDGGGNPTKESYIIDGQHRCRVLAEFYKEYPAAPSFPVVVLERPVSSELEVIGLFNGINNSKPLKYTDVNLVVNEYIAVLERAFNVKKRGAAVLIRPKATCRPYLSADKLRDALVANQDKLRTGAADIARFVERVQVWNTEKVRTADLDALASPGLADTIEKAAKVGFMLGVEARLPWVGKLL
jgi:hypothetical protein